MSPRFAPVLFSLNLSALMSLFVSGIATFRDSLLPNDFVEFRVVSWLPFWFFAFPALIAAAARARRPGRELGKVPAMQVQ